MQTDRQKYRQTDRNTDRYKGRYKDRYKDIQICIKTDRHTDTEKYKDIFFHEESLDPEYVDSTSKRFSHRKL